MAQRRGFQMVGGGGGENAGGGGGGGGGGGQYYYNNNSNNNNETTYYTKIFVGGLAWETQRDTMRHYFEQFGEIQEAVVITDKNTGRSKGYGFVTFRDPESAMRACQNPSPVIDGRRANCNLASLGAHKTHPPTPPQHGRFRPVPGLVTPPGYQGSSSSSTYFHQPTSQYAFPYSAYGYSAGYSQDTMYPMNYYSVYGGQQYQPYYAATAAAAVATGASSGSPGIFQNFYPYYAQYAQSGQSHHGFGVQYPQMLQYPYLPQQHYASTGILSLPSSTSIAIPTTSTAAVTSTTSVAVPVVSQSQATGTASEQSSST